jgi:hypothetical protein
MFESGHDNGHRNGGIYLSLQPVRPVTLLDFAPEDVFVSSSREEYKNENELPLIAGNGGLRRRQ